jgi:hypothetical protein
MGRLAARMEFRFVTKSAKVTVGRDLDPFGVLKPLSQHNIQAGMRKHW